MPATVAFLLAASVMAPQSAPTVRTPNVKTVTVTAVDATARTVTVQVAGGAAEAYACTDSTLMRKDRRPVSFDAFKPGETVVVRFRRSKTAPCRLYDLMDRGSWTWMDGVRHHIQQITVHTADTSTLSGTIGPDAVPVEYRVTARTQWALGGKGDGAAAPRAGDLVWVVPRLLPSGGTMATAVASTEAGAKRLQDEARPTATGSVVSLDVAKRTLQIRARAGYERTLPLAQDCEVTLRGKTVPVTAVQPGQTVTAHIRRNNDERQVTRIAIQVARQSSKQSRIRPSAK